MIHVLCLALVFHNSYNGKTLYDTIIKSSGSSRLINVSGMYLLNNLSRQAVKFENV